MRARLSRLLPMVAAILLAPVALAAEDADTVTARSPVVLQGASLAHLGEGMVLLSSEDLVHAVAKLTADRARVLHVREEVYCTGSTCFPDVTDLRSGRGRFELEDVRLGALAAREGFLLQLETDEDSRTLAYANAPATIAVEEKHTDWGYPCLEPATCGPSSWSSHGEGMIFYMTDAWDLTTSGAFRVVLFGMDVQLQGEGDDGEYSRTFETGRTEERGAGPGGALYSRRVVEYLILDVEQGAFSLEAVAPGRVCGDLVVDATGRTTFQDATGVLVVDGRRVDLDGDDATVVGNVSLAPLTTVPTGDGGAPFLVLQNAYTGVIAPASVEPTPTPASAAAIGVVSLAALAAAAAAWFWPYLKYAGTAAVLPLYSRIGREEVLEHGKRDEIFRLIRDSPGIHAHEISSRASVGWGTTVYHLKLLENHGLVVGKRTGRYKRFFAAAGGASRQVDAYAVLRNDTTAAIARHVLAAPGCIQKEVCGALGITPSLVTWHMNRLEEAGLVKKVRDGRTVRYYAGAGWSGLQLGWMQTATPATAAVVDAGPN